MSLRLSRTACAGCRTLARSLHTTTVLPRVATKANGGKQRYSPSFPPNRSSARSNPQNFSPRPPDRRVEPPLSLSGLIKKIDSHLRTNWLGTPAGSVEAFRITLGISEAEFKILANQFAGTALELLGKYERDSKGKGKGKDVGVTVEGEEGREGLEWDYQGLMRAYEEQGIQVVQLESTKFFLRWCQALFNSQAHNNPGPTLRKLNHLAILTDFRYPGEVHPFARQTRRKLILHVGPTNSGKTYSALIALSRARTGVYAGPLRLLAHEVFTRFNEGKIGNEGKRVCNLLTGEERKVLDVNESLASCTVEMFPLSRKLDVGVIDEIQMIGDVQRGSAWTSAVVGSQCVELHLCGEESVVDLIQSIAKDLGDDCEVRRYERLSPLAIAKESLGGDIGKIRKGDCLVTFSRNNIFAMKKLVETTTGLKVAVAYGGLPPEVREEQAKSFNEGLYDVLVASDAVGMGLNLKIKRIVFETLHKWDPKSRSEVPLSMPQIKQIAGRAGRFGFHPTIPVSPSESDPNPSSGTVAGEVTTLDENDMALLGEAMNSPIVQVKKAAFTPMFEVIQEVKNLLPPSTTLSTTFGLVADLGRTGPDFFSTPFAGVQSLLDLIEDVEPLSLRERNQLGMCPVNLRDEQAKLTVRNWSEHVAAGRRIMIEPWAEGTGLRAAMDRIASARTSKAHATNRGESYRPSEDTDLSLYTPTILQLLESNHRSLTLYCWLTYRIPLLFTDLVAVRALRSQVESNIELVLEGMKFERKKSTTKKVVAATG